MYFSFRNIGKKLAKLYLILLYAATFLSFFKEKLQFAIKKIQLHVFKEIFHSAFPFYKNKICILQNSEIISNLK